jgi:hypothetical protein
VLISGVRGVSAETVVAQSMSHRAIPLDANRRRPVRRQLKGSVMMDLDTGPSTPLLTHDGRVIKMVSAIKSQYSCSPETYFYVKAAVDIDGESRVVRFRQEASAYRCAGLPLLSTNDPISISAHSFNSRQISIHSVVPRWPNLRRVEKLPDGVDAPRVILPAMVVDKKMVLITDHRHSEEVAHFKLDLQVGNGKTELAYCKVRPSSHFDAVMAEVGTLVKIEFTESHYSPGELNVRSFETDV